MRHPWPIVECFADHDLTDLGATWPHVWKKTANLTYFIAPNHQNWEAGFQGRPPNALGDLGNLDGGIEGVAQTLVAGQAAWPGDPLGSLEPSGLPI